MQKLIELFKNNRRWSLALWIFISGFLVFSILGIQQKQNDLRIKKIRVSIEPKEELAFLDSQKVLEIIKGNDSGKIIIGAAQNSLDISEMESALERYPFIDQADVSMDISGKLILKVRQRNPVLRIIGQGGNSYYVAKNGFKMPLHQGFAPRVLVASGNIAESLADSTFLSTTLMLDLLKIAGWCSNDEFWHSQIEQLYVDNYMDIILIPKVGNHSIVFGSAERLEEKFKLLKTFYLKGLNVVGWDKYQRINLKFQGQIVAEKKENQTKAQIILP